ncbi:hypothetical protein BSKO_13576 [Bryopsis sp. KO-2023]|nr:hypothetical protein BSKO_13576 [Bryopsis sp. KO-2023]
MSKNFLGEKLPSPPSDGVSAVRFSSTSDLLLVASWDASIRLYDANERQMRGMVSHGAPVLDCNFQDEKSVFSGGLDGKVQSHDFYHQGNPIVLGNHQKAVRCVEYLKEQGLVASGGWDGVLNLWDPRQYQSPIVSIQLPGKVFTAAHTAERLVVGTSERHVLVYDLRNISGGQPDEHRESSLRHQTRCIRSFPDGQGYGLGSTEGRVAIEFFGSSNEGRKYAFKCHRKKVENREVVYPVNAIAFHPVHGTFATGGCDGAVYVWDGDNKKRLSQVSGFPASIAALDFNRNGTLLAIASSYTFEQGEKDHAGDEIYVRPIQDSEAQPKPRKSSI